MIYWTITNIMRIGRLIRNFFNTNNRTGMQGKFDKEELKKRLTPEQYKVTQENGTERPFKSKALIHLRLILQRFQARNL